MPAGIETITLIGPFAQGEIPDPTTFEFFKTPRDLTGFALSVELVRDDEIVAEIGTAEWSDQANGVARYEWGDGDCSVPADLDYVWYDLFLWAEGPDTRYRSQRARFMVTASTEF